MCVCVSPCPRVPMSLCFLPPVASADGPCSHPVRPGILQLRRGAVRSLCRTCRLIALLRLDVGTGLGDGASSFARVHPMIVYFAGGGNQAFGTPKVAFPKGQGNPCVWGSQQSRSSAIFGIVCPWWSGCRISWNFAATGWGAGGSALEGKREFGGEGIKIDGVLFCVFLRAPYRFKVLLLI